MEDTQSKITGCPEGMGAKSRSLMAPRCQKAGLDRAWQQRSHKSSLPPPGWGTRLFSIGGVCRGGISCLNAVVLRSYILIPPRTSFSGNIKCVTVVHFWALVA